MCGECLTNMETKIIGTKRKQADLSKFYQVIGDRNNKKQAELQQQCDRVVEEIFGDGPTIGGDDNEGNQEEPQTPDSQPVLKSKK
ncbi:hypothetical protein L7F22_065960 [Adiantum nelumboides]|nr:hypothetical protein [Adiantum nelumboides]